MDSISQNIEEIFVKSFVLQDKQQRYIELLAKPKRRSKILGHLNHKFDYNRKYANSIDSSCTDIVELLKSKGAPENCHVIADTHKLEGLDGKDLDLVSAVEALCYHTFAYIIICDPEHLAYFQPEAPARPIVLMKK